MHTKTLAAVSALTLITSAGLAQTSTWNLTTDGFWSVPTNWTPANAPITMTSDAFIPNNGMYTISVGGNFDTDDILNVNPNATISLNVSRQHELFGNFDNSGTYIINTTNGAAQTSLIWSDTANIDGDGDILLNGFSTRARLIVNPGATVTHGANHTIHGFGQIFGDFINNGTIGADNPFNTLDFRFGNITNNGVIGASNDGILDLNFVDLIITQSAAGVVRANGGTVSVHQASISGGSVEGINGGAVVSDGSPTFDDVTINGDVQVAVSRTLNLSDTITNNGTILVNPTNAAAVTTLDADNNVLLTGPGKVTLNGFTTRAQITTAGGGVLTNDAGHTIDGFGRIFGNVINNGTITANNPGNTLLNSGENKTNNGIMSADGGILEINNFTLDQTGGGVLAANTSNIVYNGPEIEGGTLTSGSGIHEVVFLTELRAVQNEAQFNVSVGDALQIRNSITNNGNILINPTNGAAQTLIRFMDSGSFNGNGSITLNGFTTRAQIVTIQPSSFVVTNGANHTIHGFGLIRAPMVNEGMIRADVAGQELVIESSITNNNTIQSLNDARLELTTGSEITQTPGAKVTADNAEIELQNTTIIGGSIESSGTGVFNVQSGTTRLTSVTNNASLVVEPGQTLELSGTHTNNSVLNLNPTNGAAVTSLEIQNDLTIEGPGELNLSGFTTRAQITSVTGMELFTNSADHTITGIGRIATPMVNHGTIAPGLSAGILDATSPITLGDSSVLEIEVGGLSSHDVINSTSTFHADGVLDLSLIDGFTPTESWVVTIVTADGGVTGTFDTLIAPAAADPRLSYKIGYFEDEIRVGAVCDTDFDFSGGLNFLDVSIFLNLYGEMNPIADINNDGNFNFLDISAFLASYGKSCP